MTRIALTFAMFLLLTAAAGADDKYCRPPETPCESHARAGFPQCISQYARPSRTPNYDGYYVGGGAPLLGESRCPCEGTWGWDYVGVVPKIVDLGWWHGRQAQSGGGAYATDHR